LFAIQRSCGFLLLASGYLFSSIMVVPWVLTFPGVADVAGLIEPGPQTTAMIAAARRIGFALMLLAYALSITPQPAARATAGRPVKHVIVASIAAVLALAAGVAWFAVAGQCARRRRQ
jgi:hypothetical protein